jgi:hypothetical protein
MPLEQLLWSGKVLLNGIKIGHCSFVFSSWVFPSIVIRIVSYGLYRDTYQTVR